MLAKTLFKMATFGGTRLHASVTSRDKDSGVPGQGGVEVSLRQNEVSMEFMTSALYFKDIISTIFTTRSRHSPVVSDNWFMAFAVRWHLPRFTSSVVGYTLVFQYFT